MMTNSEKLEFYKLKVESLENTIVELEDELLLLEALEQLGVDNWEGWDEAVKLVSFWKAQPDGD